MKAIASIMGEHERLESSKVSNYVHNLEARAK